MLRSFKWMTECLILIIKKDFSLKFSLWMVYLARVNSYPQCMTIIIMMMMMMMTIALPAVHDHAWLSCVVCWVYPVWYISCSVHHCPYIIRCGVNHHMIDRLLCRPTPLHHSHIDDCALPAVRLYPLPGIPIPCYTYISVTVFTYRYTIPGITYTCT